MITRVSPHEAQQLLEQGYLYLDVRSVPEFEQGHPAGAFNVPLLEVGPHGMEPNAAFMSVVESSFPKDAKLVVGCRSGGRSLRAAEMMAAAGYGCVVDLRPGFGGARDPFGQLSEAGWEAAGLPVAHRAEPGRSYRDLASRAA